MNAQLLLDFDLPNDGQLIEGAPNMAALSWVRSGNWPIGRGVIVGAKKSGKSSMAAAILDYDRAWNIQKTRDVQSFIEEHGEIAVIDDADDFIRTKDGQAALFHLYNYCQSTGARLMLFATSAPADWGVELPDLASRLATISVSSIEAPDDMMMVMLLANGFHRRGVLVSSKLVDYAATRLDRSYAEIETFIEHMDLLARQSKSKITRRLAADYFEEKT